MQHANAVLKKRLPKTLRRIAGTRENVNGELLLSAECISSIRQIESLCV